MISSVCVKLKISVIVCSLFVFSMYSAEEKPKSMKQKSASGRTFTTDFREEFWKPFSLRREISLVATAHISLQDKVAKFQYMRDKWSLPLEDKIEISEITKYWESELLEQQKKAGQDEEENKSQKK